MKRNEQIRFIFRDPESESELKPSGAKNSSLLNARTFTFIILAFSLLLGLGEVLRRKGLIMGERKEAMDNCRQIIIGLRLYSPDNSGLYPDGAYLKGLLFSVRGMMGPIDTSHAPRTANAVFRDLFRCGVYTSGKDELNFGCPRSPFHPDGYVGSDPGWKMTLQSGENHWAMVGDMNDSSPSDLPLVFENPADAIPPLRWNTDAAGKAEPGRCWQDRKVLVGFNDGSVRWMPLEAGSGLRKLEMMEREEWAAPAVRRKVKKDVFEITSSSGEPTRILQVDE